MAYRIISNKKTYVQYTLLDFIIARTLEIIDLRTRKGKKRFRTLFRSTSRPRAQRISLTVVKAIALLFSIYNERDRRLFAGFLANINRFGGVQKAKELTGLSKKTVKRGWDELNNPKCLDYSRIRCKGGGRLSKARAEPQFEATLQSLIEDEIAGDPMKGLMWTRKTMRWMKRKLEAKGIKVSLGTIWNTLGKLGISLKKNKKTESTQHHPMRNAQFRYISKMTQLFLALNKPVISIDTKKKELIGNLKNEGRIWRKEAYKVFDHDFPSLAEGKLIPFGIYDLKYNEGTVYCGTTHETSEFGVDCICEWWKEHGQKHYPNQFELLILCDSGGANGYRRRQWKRDLQTRLANCFGLSVHVCHYPPGTSKYNPIERKLFSFISKNWAGEPLTSYEKALSLIRSTKTITGLSVEAALLEKEYMTGIKISNGEMEALNLKRAKTCPLFNYCICPQ